MKKNNKRPEILLNFYYEKNSDREKKYSKNKLSSSRLDVSRLMRGLDYWENRGYGTDTWEKKRLVISHWGAFYHQEDFDGRMDAFIKYLKTLSFELFVLDETGNLLSINRAEDLCNQLRPGMIESAIEMRQRLYRALQTANNDGIPLEHYEFLDDYKLEAALHEYENNQNSEKIPFSYSVSIPENNDLAEEERLQAWESILGYVAVNGKRIKHLCCSFKVFEEEKKFFHLFPNLESLVLIHLNKVKRVFDQSLLDKINQGNCLKQLVLNRCLISAGLVGQLNKIEKFELTDCQFGGIENQTLPIPLRIKTLAITGMDSLGELNLSQYTKLTTLRLSNCRVTRLTLPPQLRTLSLAYCRELEGLQPPLQLETLTIYDVDKINNNKDFWEQLSQANQLKVLHISRYFQFEKLQLPLQLEILSISGSIFLEGTTATALDLRQHTRLKDLSLVFCNSTQLQQLQLPQGLKGLQITYCVLPQLQELQLPPQLETLTIANTQFKEPPVLNSMTQLKNMKIRSQLKKGPPLRLKVAPQQLSQLKNFSAIDYNSQEPLDFSSCTQLETLKLVNSASKPLPQSLSVRRLKIEDVLSLGALDLRQWDQLRILEIHSCKLKGGGIHLPRQLETLVIGGRHHIEALDFQGDRLKTVKIQNIGQVGPHYDQQLATLLRLLPSLSVETLTIIESTCSTPLELKRFIRLKTLELIESPNVRIERLPPHLETLRIRNNFCGSLERLDLRDYARLKVLDIEGCNKLREIILPQLSRSIRCIKISDSFSIENLENILRTRWQDDPNQPFTCVLLVNQSERKNIFVLKTEEDINSVMACYKAMASYEKSVAGGFSLNNEENDVEKPQVISFDTGTYVNPNQHCSTEQYIYQYKNQTLRPVDDGNYREHIFPILEEASDGGLKLLSELSEKKSLTTQPTPLAEILVGRKEELLSKSSDLPQYVGQIEVPCDRWVPLTMLTVEDHLMKIHCLSEQRLQGEKRYHLLTQQDEIRLTLNDSQKKGQKIGIQYSFVTDPSQNQNPYLSKTEKIPLGDAGQKAKPISLASTEEELISNVNFNNNQSLHLGELEVPCGDWTALTNLGPHDCLMKIYCPLESSLKGKQRYNSLTQQHEIQLDNGQDEEGSKIKIQYSFVKSSIQDLKPQLPRPHAEAPPLYRKALDFLLLEATDVKKKSGYPERFVKLACTIQKFKEGHVSQSKLIQDLCNYFRGAANENLDSAYSYKASFSRMLVKLQKPLQEVPGLIGCLRVLVENKGACRHRAELFTLLCQYLKVPARVINNQTHEYAEYLDEQGAWKKKDLGGAEVNFQANKFELNGQEELLQALGDDPSQVNSNNAAQQAPLHSLSNQQDKNAGKMEDRSKRAVAGQFPKQGAESTDNSLLQPILLPRNNDLSKYDQYFVPQAIRALRAHQQNYLEALYQEGHRGLVEVSDDSEAQAVYAALCQRAQKDKLPTVFVNSQDSVGALYRNCKVESNCITSLAGPLEILLQEGGLLVIDWRRIPPDDIGSLKSLLDNPPTFLPPGQAKPIPIAKTVRIIGLTSPEQGLPAPAKSRMIFWPRLPETLRQMQASVIPLQPIENKDKNKKNKKEKRDDLACIDLYNSPYWQKKLLGYIEFSEAGITYRQGLFLNHLNQGGLKLRNAPLNDPEFQRLLKAVNIERKIIINGGTYLIPAGFNLYCDHEPLSVAQAKIFTEPEQINWNAENLFFLNLNNVPQLFEEIVVKFDQESKKNRFISQPGWLEQAFKDFNGQGQQPESVIVLTESVPPSLLSEIQNAINKLSLKYKSKNTKIKFVDLTTAKTKLAAIPLHQLPQQQLVTLTKDPYFEAACYVRQHKILEAHVVDITHETDLSQLIVKIEVDGIRYRGQQQNQQQGKGRLGEIIYEEQAVLRELKGGGTVILRGTLSQELYQQLETLLAPKPFLRVNGKDCPIKGRLVVYSWPVTYSLPGVHFFQGDPEKNLDSIPWDRYQELLKEDYRKQQKNFDFNNFFETVKSFFNDAHLHLAVGQYGTPPSLRISYARLSAMMAAWSNPQEGRDNPMKPILGYDFKKDSEAYALLNVLSKLYFSYGTKERIKYDHLQDYPKTEDYFWRRANCFPASQLRQALGLKKRPNWQAIAAMPFDQLYLRLEKKVSEHSKPKVAQQVRSLESVRKNPLQKNLNRLDQCLSQRRAVFLQGPPGSGKTTAANKYVSREGRQPFWGEKGILEWLKSTAKEPCLVLDEANTSQPGTWDFLYPLIAPGLSTSNPLQSVQLSYQGKSYFLKNHKVIFTGNPSYYAARMYHPVLQDVQTLYFNEWGDDDLYEFILNPLYAQFIDKISPHQNQKGSLDSLKKLIAAYRLAQKTYRHCASLRDLQQIMLRWQQGLSLFPDSSENEMLFEACLTEWGDLKPSKKDHFRRGLREIFPQEKEKRLKKEFSLLNETNKKTYYSSPTMLDCAYKVNQDLEINEQRVKHGSGSVIGKLGTLVEGPSGVGKSELMKALLKSRGYQEYFYKEKNKGVLPAKGGKVFCQITMPTDAAAAEKVKTLLEIAYKRGWVIILDELNINSHAPAFLNHIMTGKRDGKEISFCDRHPGFYVLASQNCSSVKGRYELSADLKNRFHIVQVSDYTDNDWDHIIQQAMPERGPADRRYLITKYHEMLRTYPDSTNARNFFGIIDNILKGELTQLQPQQQDKIERAISFSDSIESNHPNDNREEAHQVSRLSLSLIEELSVEVVDQEERKKPIVQYTYTEEQQEVIKTFFQLCRQTLNDYLGTIPSEATLKANKSKRMISGLWRDGLIGICRASNQGWALAKRELANSAAGFFNIDLKTFTSKDLDNLLENLQEKEQENKKLYTNKKYFRHPPCRIDGVKYSGTLGDALQVCIMEVRRMKKIITEKEPKRLKEKHVKVFLGLLFSQDRQILVGKTNNNQANGKTSYQNPLLSS